MTKKPIIHLSYYKIVEGCASVGLVCGLDSKYGSIEDNYPYGIRRTWDLSDVTCKKCLSSKRIKRHHIRKFVKRLLK
jgi:hypothetical protein